LPSLRPGILITANIAGRLRVDLAVKAMLRWEENCFKLLMKALPSTIEHKFRRLLIILAKDPQCGNVKTRLAACIGVENAIRLYEAFLSDLAPRFKPLADRLSFDVQWVYTPHTKRFEKMIRDMYGSVHIDGLSFVAYPNPGLLDQQLRQLQWAQSAGYDHIVIIPTDTPHLSRLEVEKAFDRLVNNDVVIGPAYDGGYYILGLRERWDVLEKVSMSTNHVADDIIHHCRAAQLSVSILDKMLDIDTGDDLVMFMHFARAQIGILCPHTLLVLKSLELMHYPINNR
jgi:rSAM/selenodomain-associated transferase 1